MNQLRKYGAYLFIVIAIMVVIGYAAGKNHAFKDNLLDEKEQDSGPQQA